MKLAWNFTLRLALASLCSGIVFASLPELTQQPIASYDRKAVASETEPSNFHLNNTTSKQKGLKVSLKSRKPQGAIAQNAPIPGNLGEQILGEVTQCVVATLGNLQQASRSSLEAASIQCVFKVVMLDPNGGIRPDANERIIALVKVTGVSLPKPVRQGQASVQLQPLENQLLFTVPVKIGAQFQTFLLDTGASNSIVDRQIAQELELEGTPIPNDLLAYMVVGDDCSDVNAQMHRLPQLVVDSATVEGITGMGLPKTAIPGEMAGVLGLDFLTGFDVIIDPQTLQLQLLPPSQPVAGAIPLLGRLGVMTAQVRINGQGPFTFLLDTGAELMVVSEDLARQLDLEVSSAEQIEVRGFCGTELAKRTTLLEVSLQQHQLTNLDAVILQKGVLELLGVEGIIGQNFLLRYRQHWRFSEPNELGFPETGSLVLSPL